MLRGTEQYQLQTGAFDGRLFGGFDGGLFTISSVLVRGPDDVKTLRCASLLVRRAQIVMLCALNKIRAVPQVSLGRLG